MCQRGKVNAEILRKPCRLDTQNTIEGRLFVNVAIIKEEFKRWGESISRKSYADGGNFMNELAGTWSATEKNDFVWVLPDDYKKYIRNEGTQ